MDKYFNDLAAHQISTRLLILLCAVYIGLIFRFLNPLRGYMMIQNPFDGNLAGKIKFQRWIYIIFYICVIVSLLTGMIIEWGPKNLKKIMEEIHVFGSYYLVAFIIIHIASVLLAEFTDQKGIISRIVSGRKEGE